MIERMQLEEKTNEELFQIYKETGHQRIKQELVMRYIYIVRNIAVQMKGVYVSFAQMDDIINESVIVLMNSIDKFAPNMNVKFVSTYGNLKIWKCINFTKFLIKVHLAENRKKLVLTSKI